MYKNKAENGKNNLCGRHIQQIRKKMPQKISQRQLADWLTLAGLELDKNAIQRIESGERFVTDIELKVISEVLGVSYEELLND